VGRLKSAVILATGKALPFTQEKYRIIFRDLPSGGRDTITGVTVIALEFDGEPEYIGFPRTAPLLFGQTYD
jgi:hypothetical protein